MRPLVIFVIAEWCGPQLGVMMGEEGAGVPSAIRCCPDLRGLEAYMEYRILGPLEVFDAEFCSP
jgi:hypothetical protein